MAEYLRFQLNTPPHVSLNLLVGAAGAHVMKLRFQQKVKNSGSLMALVESRVHRPGFRVNDDQVSEMMDNVNYLFYIGANCDVSDLPDHSILTRPTRASPFSAPSLARQSPSSKFKSAYLREMPRASAMVIWRLRCRKFKVKANLDRNAKKAVNYARSRNVGNVGNVVVDDGVVDAQNDSDKNCSLCNVLETEQHVLTECPKFASIREKYEPEGIALENAYSDDQKVLLEMADFAGKVESALLLEG